MKSNKPKVDPGTQVIANPITPLRAPQQANYVQQHKQFQQYQQQLLTQPVNSPQLLYQLLYNPGSNFNQYQPPTNPPVAFTPSVPSNFPLYQQIPSKGYDQPQVQTLSRAPSRAPSQSASSRLSPECKFLSSSPLIFKVSNDDKWLQTFLEERMEQRKLEEKKMQEKKVEAAAGQSNSVLRQQTETT